MHHLSPRGAYYLLNRTYWYYRTGQLALPLLEDLLYSSIIFIPYRNKYPRHPFLVLYSDSSFNRRDPDSFYILEILDDFIALPTVPSGWKALAKQLKKGTLLTKQERTHLSGYHDFIHTHFTLYDTIPPQK